MKDQRKYKATLFLSLCYAQFIGLSFGYWLAAHASNDKPIAAALVFSAWLGSMWWIWTTTRRVFWPEDFNQT